jgi:hypothetical protein|tara:strand:+ start:496 stop:711 length:216 start_codon:yes stop_codon:yes gene_type:complete
MPDKKKKVAKKKMKSRLSVESPSSFDEKKWRAEGDLRTLRNAEEIRNSPSRQREAKKVAKAEMAALKKIGG